MFATSVSRWGYKHIAKPFFFKRDPEMVHDTVTAFGKTLGSFGLSRVITRGLFSYQHPALEQEILGIRFPNPVGLTAGFDKNAELTEVMPAVGFGFEEVGSITGEPCEGNPKPRLWRLPKSKGLVVYYGLKNDGCEAIADRLSNKRFGIPIGVSIAKTNCAATADTEVGIADYVKAMDIMKDVGDYITVNVSCPNAFGGEPFGSPERLERLLQAIDGIETNKPIFVKFAVDLSMDELDTLIDVLDRHRIHGIILSNLTKKRDRAEIHQEELQGIEKGGISGKPTFEASNALIAHAFKRAGDRYVIIGSGGVFTAKDAYAKICAGASLIQLATGMIFEGPQVIGEINKGLVKLLTDDGLYSIKDAIGKDHAF